MTNKLLIVDDEDEILSTLSIFFALHEVDVKTANSAAEALKIIEKEKINIALIDINMPEMDGIELLRRIKGRDFSIQIIMMTEYSTFNKTLSSLGEGAVGYILKPFDNLDNVLELVKESARRLERWKKNLTESVKLQKGKRGFL